MDVPADEPLREHGRVRQAARFGGTTALVDTSFAKGATFAKWLSIVLYSNFHVSGAGAGTFPAVCTSGALTKDEQIVEYMLFDVTACVKDSGPK